MTTSGRRLPPVSQAVPKLPVVNEGGVIVDDIAKGDSGCVAIQQLYEDMRSDWSNFRHGEKSAKNGLDRPIQPVCCSFIYICLFIAFVINVAITHTHTAILLFSGFCSGRDNPGEPVPEETFTHSHLSWSSIIQQFNSSVRSTLHWIHFPFVN